MIGRSLSGLRILVVEDELMIAMHLQNILRNLNCTVIGPVPTVKRALAAIAGEALDGALLDTNLRSEPVDIIIDALRARAVPFLLVTSYPVRDVESEQVRAAPRVQKPFTHDVLVTRLVETFLAAAAPGSAARP